MGEGIPIISDVLGGGKAQAPDTSAQQTALAAEKKAAKEKAEQLAKQQSEEYRNRNRRGLAALIGTSEEGLTGDKSKTG